jgi:multidrug efflux pump
MLGGYTDRNLRLWVDGKKLSQRELTIDDILNTIQKEHVEVPAGLLETKTQQMNIRSMGEAPSVTMFGNLPISFRGGTPIFDSNIRIKDVALLEDGLDDVMRVSRFNGKQAVGMGIIKQRGVNAVKVAEDVRKQIELVKKDLPPGFEIGVNSDSTRFIKESIEELEFTLILSAILTSLVTWFFLRKPFFYYQHFTCHSYFYYGKFYHSKCIWIYLKYFYTARFIFSHWDCG